MRHFDDFFSRNILNILNVFADLKVFSGVGTVGLFQLSSDKL